MTLSSLPRGVHLAVDAEQILNFGNQLDPDSIVRISIGERTSQLAIERTFGLGRRNLPNLSAFSVSADGVRLSASPEELKKQWRFFDVIDSQLDEFLNALPGLRDFEIFGCPIGRIPEPIRRLRDITNLTLTAVSPASIPAWLFEAHQLTSLGLALNRLSDLPDSFGEAKRLRRLDLSDNPLRRIPSAVWKLATLESLDLARCPIEEIPADILRLERLSILITDSMQALLVPPPEIAAQGLDAIKRYWAQERDVGVDYLAEAKLLIVGESGAGKTSLAKKILDPHYELDAAEDSTEGIDVLAWQFPAGIRVATRPARRTCSSASSG